MLTCLKKSKSLLLIQPLYFSGGIFIETRKEAGSFITEGETGGNLFAAILIFVLVCIPHAKIICTFSYCV